MGKEILSNKEIKKFLKAISKDGSSEQGQNIRIYDFKRPDFVTKRQKESIGKLFSSSGYALALDFLTVWDFIRSFSEEVVFYSFLLNGKTCLAAFPKKFNYKNDNTPCKVLEHIFRKFKEEFEYATESLPYIPLDFSHFHQLAYDDFQNAQKMADILLSDFLSDDGKMGLYVSNEYYDNNLNRKTKDKLAVSIFLDKEEVQKIARAVCPEPNIVEWKGDCNALALLGGFNWNDKTKLKKDDIIPLNTMVTSPLPIIKDGKIAAYAEVMSIDENFGLKITEVVEKSPEEIVEDALEKGRRECEKMFGIKDSESNSK